MTLCSLSLDERAEVRVTAPHGSSQGIPDALSRVLSWAVPAPRQLVYRAPTQRTRLSLPDALPSPGRLKEHVHAVQFAVEEQAEPLQAF